MAGKLPMIQLRCRVTMALDAADLERDAALLDAEERQAAQRLIFAEDRRDYVAAHVLLRRSLSDMSPGIPPAAWRFARTDSGKPFVVGREAARLPFSLSHTRGLVACAVGQAGDVGTDVERDARFDVDELSASVCSPDERAQLDVTASPDRTSLFLDLWTLKEAYVKARGIGIVGDLTGMAFDLRNDAEVSAALPGQESAAWLFALWKPTPDSRVALAVEQHGGTTAGIDAALVENDGTLTALRPIRIGAFGSGAPPKRRPE